ncbi:hypothetical protein, partial [Streptomyces sp. NPDC127092]|uniref:hypothetical protein n=1 Tax=Streptomyces sp. NPDC127092 TaxID=3347135 RepID=UPI0036578489
PGTPNPSPGAVIPAEPAGGSARRGAPTVALNVRVPEATREAVRREAAANPVTPSQAAGIKDLVRAHLMC